MSDLIDRNKLHYDIYHDHKGDLSDTETVAEILLRLETAEVIEKSESVQWVSIDKKLPEVGQFVLVYYPKWGNDAIQVGMLESDRLHFDICGEYYFPVNKVTHWMPLPEKPEVIS